MNTLNMSFKYLAFIFPILICINAKSFTLVIDTTQSMQNDLYLIKTNIAQIFQRITNTTVIENYIIVPFNDPEIGPIRTFTSPDKLIESIRSLQVSGGHDIPENSLSGLETALRASKPESDIFLFTDACANDNEKFRDVQNLCASTRSKVVIFMNGNCAYSERNLFGRIELYYDVAKVCSGSVFRFEPANFRQAFSFMREITRDYNDVKPFESFTGYRQLFFTADSFTTDIIVAVSGEFPALLILGENGQSPWTEKLIDTKHSLVHRIVHPHKGQYQITVRCQGVTWVTIYKRVQFPFQIGFSGKQPKSIEETASRPLPGKRNYILIVVPQTNNIQIKTMIMQVLDGMRQNLNLVQIPFNSHKYVGQAFFDDQKPFRITITGREGDAYEDFEMTGKILVPQIADTNAPSSAAVVNIIKPESPLTDYEKSTQVACKVTGSPKPKIWWEDENETQIASEEEILEYPTTYITYLSINSLTVNKTVSCKAQTPNGEDSKSIELFVYRPYVFQMIQTPSDATFEYGTEGRLFCEVHAYPEAEIKWYHNDSLLIAVDNNKDDSENSFKKSDFEYVIESNALVIKNVTTRFTGTYKCEVQNEVENRSYIVNVSISGLEPPEIETVDTEITAKLGDEVEITCRVIKGTPNPVLTWKYKSVDGYEFTDIPNGIDVEGEKLKIGEVQSQHKGSYLCQAVNEQGQVSREVTLNVHYAPTIEEGETRTYDILEDFMVELKCSVDADPKATVRWERSQGDIIVPFDDKHVTDDENTHKFRASFNDSGTYRCVAENEAGTAEKVAMVNVLVPPYITPVPDSKTVRAGTEVLLLCNVQYANPPPSIVWKFTALDSTSTVLFSDESIYSKELHIKSASRAQAGIYLCIAENSVGFDRIHINLNVV